VNHYLVSGLSAGTGSVALLVFLLPERSKNVLTATISAGALVPKRLLYPRGERPKVLVDPLPRAHNENVVHFGSFVLSLFYLRRSNLTSLNQKGMVIGKGQQMRILTVALLVLDLAIIGYILRQIIEIVSVCW
jgi:hypothetical protein